LRKPISGIFKERYDIKTTGKDEGDNPEPTAFKGWFEEAYRLVPEVLPYLSISQFSEKVWLC
jgi:hypothetical protein